MTFTVTWVQHTDDITDCFCSHQPGNTVLGLPLKRNACCASWPDRWRELYSASPRVGLSLQVSLVRTRPLHKVTPNRGKQGWGGGFKP